MEKALRFSSQNFFDNENDLLCVTKDFVTFNFLSEKWSRVLRWSQSELNAKKMSELVHPDDLEKTTAIFELARGKTKVYSFENRLISKTDEIKWFEWRFFYEDENDSSLFCLARDVTVEKLKDHQLKLFQQHASLGTWTYHSKTDEFYCSDELFRIYELESQKNFSYAQNSSFYDQSNWSKINSAFMRCLEEGIPWNLEAELTTSTGNLKWVQTWGFPILLGEKIIGVEGMILDLTPRKNEELLLKQTVEELDKIQLSINQHCLVARLNPHGLFMDVNRVFEKKSGYRLPEFIGKHFEELMNVRQTPIQLEEILQTLTAGEKWRGEIRFQEKQGEPFWVDMSMTPILDQSTRQLYEIVCIGYDITEKKLNDERYQSLITGINAGIWDLTDISKSEVFWSPKCFEILEYDAQKIVPTTDFYYSLIHPDDVGMVAEKVRLAKENESSFLIEYRMLCGSGRYKWVQKLAIILRDEQGRPYRMLGSLTDINQKKLVEFNLEEEKQKSIQNSKLATLGEMAAGLAHEVNNPLTIIFGYIRILEEEMLSHNLNYELMHKHVGLIKNAAQRAAKIVTNLKDFARDGSTDPFTDVPASELINMVMDLCSERFKKHGIKVEIHIKNDPNIYCRKIELSQVLLNLVFNSFDAIEVNHEKWVKIMVEELPHLVEISVIDSGRGLSAEVSEKVFTPFFTTKKVGHGTGIGLSISQRIVLNHGGDIFYDPSSPNTKFIIRLPFHGGL